MSIQTQIKEQVKDAMKSHDAVKLSVVRGLVAQFTNELVSLKRKPDGELTDDEAMAVIRRAVKQRKDSIEQFTKGGRQDLAENENAELTVLETYLPAQMPSEDIKKIIQSKMAELGISDKSGMGKLMGAVMKETKGNVDGDVVKNLIEELLK